MVCFLFFFHILFFCCVFLALVGVDKQNALCKKTQRKTTNQKSVSVFGITSRHITDWFDGRRTPDEDTTYKSNSRTAAKKSLVSSTTSNHQQPTTSSIPLLHFISFTTTNNNMSTTTNNATVKLESSDEQVFEVPREVAEMSVTVKHMLDDVDADNENAIPLPNVTGKILGKVIEWAKYHLENPEPAPAEGDAAAAKDEKRTDDISPWDKNFCDVDQPTLFELILAANYLDIKPLLDLTCKTVANMIKGKSPEEIRKTFNIKYVQPSLSCARCFSLRSLDLCFLRSDFYIEIS